MLLLQSDEQVVDDGDKTIPAFWAMHCVLVYGQLLCLWLLWEQQFLWHVGLEAA